jgi:acetolactate decarboxylase
LKGIVADFFRIGLPMKTCWLYLLVCVCVLAGCQTTPVANTVTQYSTIDALLAGAYDGVAPCQEVLQYGDLGIGTFDKLDGEMVVLDGVVYQVPVSGQVRRVEPSMTTPFATVCFFETEVSFDLDSNTSFDALKARMDQAVPNPNVFCAVKLHGHFKTMKTRSVPAQKKPYPALAEVVESQVVFNMKDVTGSIVGFRSPPFVKGINVPGYHLHFLSDDRTQGGHILDFDMDQAVCHMDVCDRFFMILPENGQGLEEIDLAVDRAEELQKVEQ